MKKLFRTIAVFYVLVTTTLSVFGVAAILEVRGILVRARQVPRAEVVYVDRWYRDPQPFSAVELPEDGEMVQIDSKNAEQVGALVAALLLGEPWHDPAITVVSDQYTAEDVYVIIEEASERHQRQPMIVHASKVRVGIRPDEENRAIAMQGL